MQKNLPKTLALRLQLFRSSANLSIEKLANITNIDAATICDIEEGRDTFLSTTTRQKLSKALKISSNLLKDVEVLPKKSEVPKETINYLKEMILSDLSDGLRCPKCNNKLNCKTVTLYDLENNPVRHPKARCNKCPFQIK